MTLPVELHRIRGVKLGPRYDYKVGPQCSVPGCSSWAQGAHHIASAGGGGLGVAFDWVEIDGTVVGNKTGLCYEHHNVAIHDQAKAEIKWIDGAYWWCLMGGSKLTNDREAHAVGPLTYQPPTPDSLVEQTSGPVVESDHCPMCGQTKRRRLSSPPGGRRRKTWIVKVPDEEVEDGADVLDTLVENLALLVPNADASATGRYYVLVPVLAYATMNTKNFLETMSGVGG